RVVNVLFVGHAKDEHLAPLDRLAVIVERVADSLHDVRGHGRVDLAGQLDEPRGQAEFACDPGEVEGVDGYAVPAQARAGVKRLVAKRLRFRRFDHLPNVDTHAVVEDLQLIDEGDINGAVRVFQDFAGLGHLGRGDRHHFDDYFAVERN